MPWLSPFAPSGAEKNQLLSRFTGRRESCDTVGGQEDWMTLDPQLAPFPDAPASDRPFVERVRDSLRQMGLALGVRGVVWATAAGAVGLVCGVVSLTDVALSLGTTEVAHSRNKAAEIQAFDQSNRALIRSILTLSTGRGRLAEGDLPVSQAWARVQAARGAVCNVLDDRASNVAELRAMCAAIVALHERFAPEIAAFDPPRRLIDPGVMHDALTLHARVNDLTAATIREADLLVGRMADEYREALWVLSLSTGGFAAACLVLIVLVGRASIRHYEQSRQAGEARDLLEETIEALPAGVVLYDRNERLVTFNSAAVAATPVLKRPGIIGITYEELARETAKLAAGFGAPLLNTPEEWIARFRSKGARRMRQSVDGRWFEWSEKLTRSGRTVGLRVDVTELKTQELEAERARAEYQSLVDSMSDVVYALDVRGVFTFVSAAAAEVLGMPADRMVGTRFRDHVPAEDVDRVLANGRAFHQSPSRAVQQKQLRMTAADGTIRHVEVRYRKPVGEEGGQTAQIGVIRDISERVELTARLERQVAEIERARADYQALVDSLADMVFRIDARSAVITFVSASSAELFGLAPERMIGTRAFDHIVGDDLEYVMATVQASLKNSDGRMHRLQYRIRTADGVERHVEARFRKLPAADGGPVIAGVMHDIEERVELTRRLDTERARLHSIVESSGALIVLVDRSLTVVVVNSGFTAVTGIGAAQAVGRPLKEIIDCPLDARVLDGWLAGPLDPGRIEPVRFANQVRDRQGRQRLISVTATPVLDESRRVNSIVFLGVDDTERREAERALFDAERLATVGEMAATVAHEIAQPLQVINIACASAQQELAEAADAGAAPDGTFLHGKLDRIARQVERAGRIVGELRAFMRGAAADDAAPFDPATAVHAAIDLTQYAVRQAGVTLAVSVAGGLPRVKGHVGRLEQVVVNLIINARDAGGRSVGVAARPLERDGRGFVQITVEDSGPGIPADVLPRLFEGFVTTKPRGKGTGFGLRISRRIVEEMGGTLSAANRAEGGARFEVVLPAAAEV